MGDAALELAAFPRRCGVDGERMHAAGELGSERRVDHAMAFEPALSAKGFRHNIESEMRLAAGPVSGMALMAMGFVLDMQAFGRESIAQLFRDEIACLHGAL
jgi:hypothetical protein